MKERQKDLIGYIVEDEFDTDTLLDLLDISRRTLYYDIEELNYLFRSFGEIKKINKKYYFVGDQSQLNVILARFNHNLSYEEIYNYILSQIMKEKFTTIEEVASDLSLSRNSVVNFINQIKIDLAKKRIILDYDTSYFVAGDEYEIRLLYISLIYEDSNILNNDYGIIDKLNQEFFLELTDFSKAFLASYYHFILLRIEKGRILTKKYFKVNGYEELNEYLKINEFEFDFFVAFMKSLSSRNNSEINHEVHSIVNRMLTILDLYAIEIVKRDEFIKNIVNHLESSYFRIKYGFPIKNLILEDLKSRNNYIYKLSKIILTNQDDFPELKGIRDEEIAFIASYIGGYINNSKRPENRILIVCPHGLMTSNIIKQQLLLNIPAIEIVDMISVSNLENYQKEYDYIISTVNLKYPNVIIVNQILSKLDIQTIISQCFKNYDLNIQVSINPLIDVIKSSCSVKNAAKLEKDLKQFFNIETRKEQHMLDDLVSRDRIQIVEKVNNWEEAISLASQPLIKDQSINQRYIKSMIDAVKEHGPYIVLQEKFAMPHASNTGGVNRLSISVLVTKEAVDLLGKEVNIFFVLAPIDNTSHLKALVGITELFSDKANIEKVIEGDQDTILELIKTERS